MEDFLYLDTARMGRPSQQTLHTANDYLALAAHEGGSAYFDLFLRQGLAACPDWMTNRFSELQTWRGFAAFKADLRNLVGAGLDTPVILANRSAQLMGFAARLFFPRCRNVLICDLGWSAYHDVLQRAACETSRRVTNIALKDLIFRKHLTSEEVVDRVEEEYAANQCDGLFLPAVSNLGVKLPIEAIVRRLERNHEVRFVVVDGAQELNHLDAKLITDYCDLYLTGSQKWLAAHHPMGIGFFGRVRSSEFISTMLSRYLEAGIIDDPLLRLEQQISQGIVDHAMETVALSSLFTCQSAATESLNALGKCREKHEFADNRILMAEIARSAGWEPIQTDINMQTRILLAQSKNRDLRRLNPISLRKELRERSIGVTVYDNAILRFSLSASKLNESNIELLSSGLQICDP
jgi:selenocysteine lyase/cysteine desulfurase